MKRWRLEEGGRDKRRRPPPLKIQVMTRALVRVAGHLEGQEMKSARRGSAARDREIAETDKQRQAESRSSVMSETARMIKKKKKQRAGGSNLGLQDSAATRAAAAEKPRGTIRGSSFHFMNLRTFPL